MASLKLAFPTTFTISDIDDQNKEVVLTFDVLFRKMNKKKAKTVVPKELSDLLKRANAITKKEETATPTDMNAMLARIKELKNEVVTASFKMQVFGKDADKLATYALDNDIEVEIIQELIKEMNETKKKL